MKYFILLLLLALPSIVLGQEYSEEMQATDMQQFAQMASCMQEIDQNRLQEYQQQSLALAAKLQTLCANGKRKEAEQAVLDYHQKLANDPVLKAINACMEVVEGDSFTPDESEEAGEQESATHICDEL